MPRYRTIVFFDLETTGLDVEICDIIQLSAICGETVFNDYTFPRIRITRGASRVTGFTTRKGTLYLHGEPVDTTPHWEALTSFIDFLRSFRRPMMLVAHNAMRFDAPVLTKVLQEFGLHQDFLQVVSGFLDTLELCKFFYPGLYRYSQKFLVDYFLDQTYNAHDAEEDARILQELYEYWNLSRRYIAGFIHRTDEVLPKKNKRRRRRRRNY